MTNPRMSGPNRRASVQSMVRYPNGASSLQRRGGPTWRAPSVKDFLRQLAWWMEFGDVYAITGDGDRAAIICPRISNGDAREWKLSYTRLGLDLLVQMGRITMEDVGEIPGFEGIELDYVRGNQQCTKLALMHK